MITLSRFGTVVMPDKAGAELKLKLAPEGRPASGGVIVPPVVPPDVPPEVPPDVPPEVPPVVPPEVPPVVPPEAPPVVAPEVPPVVPPEVPPVVPPEVPLVVPPGSVELVVVSTPLQPASTPRRIANRQPRTGAMWGRYSNISRSPGHDGPTKG